jgi:hypothetical protein
MMGSKEPHAGEVVLRLLFLRKAPGNAGFEGIGYATRLVIEFENGIPEFEARCRLVILCGSLNSDGAWTEACSRANHARILNRQAPDSCHDLCLNTITSAWVAPGQIHRTSHSNLAVVSIKLNLSPIGPFGTQARSWEGPWRPIREGCQPHTNSPLPSRIDLLCLMYLTCPLLSFT